MCSGFTLTKSLGLAVIVGVVSFGLNNASGFFTTRSPIVHTENGPVRGIIEVSRDGRGYAAYRGIPYATPPIGNLRFKNPIPAKPWNNIFEANKFSEDCYQYDAILYGKFLGNEDCLYLNVFTPKRPNAVNLLPTMVWIHGGGFFSGGGSTYDPKYFMDQEVCLVTLNYRLGPLGFLNTDLNPNDDGARGNMGLKDQRLGLQWVKSNLASFGCNVDQVTIFGESAGAASVHAQIISNSSRGLFSKAILQSGSVLSPWAVTTDTEKQARSFGEKVGCGQKDMNQMVKCLRTLSPKQLVTPIVDIMAKAPFTEPGDMFSISVEAIDDDEAFFVENPRVLLQEGKFAKIPTIMGVNSGEGALRTARLEIMDLSMDVIDNNWNTYAPRLQIYDPKLVNVSEKMRKHYFADQPFTTDLDGFFKNFTLMVSDRWFFHPLLKSAQHHLKHVPMYCYYYDYQASLPGIYSLLKAVKSDDWLFSKFKMAMSVTKDYFKRYFGYFGPHEYGACHADELLQLFKLEWILEITQRSSDYPFSKSFVKTFTDFATNHEGLKFNGKMWPKIENDSGIMPFMKLDKKGEIIEAPFMKRIEVWESLNY